MPQRPSSQTPDDRQQVVLVTGPSGAGRSTAIRVLEDLTYETVDNLPLRLVPVLLREGPTGQALVLGLDVRNRDFNPSRLADMIETLRGDPHLSVELLYLDCRSDVLVRRYSETRRRHPLAPEDTAANGIDRELAMLAPLRANADILIDTSDLTPHDLRDEIVRRLSLEDSRRMALTIHSFSYKHGMPPGLDMVLDCRFLRNPHWQPDLRMMDGRDAAVQDYIQADPLYDGFFARVLALAEYLLPAYFNEGKSHLALAFGCTGGQHRSVAMTERLSGVLAADGWDVAVQHHELQRRGILNPVIKAGDAA